MRRYVRAAFMVALLLVAGCADPSSPGRSAPGGELPSGRTFVATTIKQAGTPKQLVAGTSAELRFLDANRLVLTAGCNSMSGTARLDGGKLAVTDIATTEMGCDPRRHQQDEWFAAFLAANPTWQLSGDELTLTSDDIEMRFTDRKVVDPDRSLTGTTWVLDTVSADGSARSVPQGVRAQLTFAADHTLTGSTGCNSFSANTTIEGSRITVTGLVSTKKACATPASEIERAMVRVLDQPMTYRIEANRLTLSTPDGAGLQFIG
jgi:heat shock protein HslJ